MMKRVIQVPIDDDLLGFLDDVSSERSQSRSDLIREACQVYLRQIRREELEEQYVQGYRRIPDEPVVSEGQVRMVGHVLPKEVW